MALSLRQNLSDLSQSVSKRQVVSKSNVVARRELEYYEPNDNDKFK